MEDQQEVVIVDEKGTEHVFPAGFDPKHAIAIVRNHGSAALPTKPVSAEDFTNQAPVAQRPLLMGPSDAGAAKQFSDPSAMKTLNAAKDTGANVGILTGLGAMGGLAAETPIKAALSSGVVRGTGQALAGGGAYYALKAAGVPAPIADALLVAAGLKTLRGGRTAAPEVPTKPEAPVKTMPIESLGTPARPTEPTLPEPKYQRDPAIDAGELAFRKSLWDKFGAKATPAESAPTPKPTNPATFIGKRNYFLKTEDVAPTPKASRGSSVGMADLPESWKAATLPPEKPPRDIGGSELAGAYQRELIQRGVRPEAARKAVMDNPDLPPDVKTQILAALMKVAGTR